MRRITGSSVRTAACYVTLGLFAASSFAYAQDSSAPPADNQQQTTTASSGGWRRVDDPPPQASSTAPQDEAPPPQDPSSPYPVYPNGSSNMNNGPADPNQAPPADNQPNYNQQPNYQSDNNQAPDNQSNNYQVPAQLMIQQGTFVTVRVNQLLSSDRNQAGDAFAATLVTPLVVNGVVVAKPGQTLGGRVVEAKKAGRIEGVARLRVQLTDLTLVDGQQIPIQSQLISRSGPTSVGRDAAAIAGTTGLGAAIGAGADWGRGAAIGAGAGLAVGTLGVLLTRGRPSIIYPEQVLTFRIEAPVTISTTAAPQAFQYVQPNEYDQTGNAQQQQPAQYAQNAPPPPPYGYSPYAYPYYGYAYPYPYPYYYGYGYPYYWGSGLSFYFGPGYWWGGRYYGGYYGRGYYGRGYYGGRGFYGRGGVVGGGFARNGGAVRGSVGGGAARGFSGGGGARGFSGGGGSHGGGRR